MIVLRLVLACHVLAVFTQSVLAGQFLAGADSPVKFHELLGWIILPISLLQILSVGVLMRSGRASLWLFFGSIFLFLGESLQVGTGYARFLDVHIPLGILVFGLVTAQAAVVFLRHAGPPK